MWKSIYCKHHPWNIIEMFQLIWVSEVQMYEISVCCIALQTEQRIIKQKRYFLYPRIQTGQILIFFPDNVRNVLFTIWEFVCFRFHSMSLMPHDEPLRCSALQPLRTLNVFLFYSLPGLMLISVITSAALYSLGKILKNPLKMQQFLENPLNAKREL